jgi:hypothetical protein
MRLSNLLTASCEKSQQVKIFTIRKISIKINVLILHFIITLLRHRSSCIQMTETIVFTLIDCYLNIN